jgi:hypothetical protein
MCKCGGSSICGIAGRYKNVERQYYICRHGRQMELKKDNGEQQYM